MMVSNIKNLTAEENKKSYAKYYYREPALPSPEQLSTMDKPMDPAKALPATNINDLLNPGYLEVETGWCVLPSGAAYVANLTKMPGVTVDMVNWWFAWHSLEDLRYKLWWPQGHSSIAINPEDRRKVLDPKIPATQKFQGITHHVVEDVGGGPENIYISFLSPEEFGFDMSRFKASNVGTLVAANGLSSLVNAPPGTPQAPAVMCHFVRAIPGGVEFRSRFWLGYYRHEKNPIFMLPPGMRIPDFAPRGLAIHNVYEYTNLAAFLPQLYNEQKGIVE